MDFKLYYKDHNIVTLCIPPHSSHILQLLNVNCFRPLKRAYSRQIENLVRNSINHITKLEFLPAFRAAHDASMTLSNIKKSFQNAKLVPLNPEAVLSKLNIRLRTLTPPIQIEAEWTQKTPVNCVKMDN
jgi:DDE superfamily endonuclease